MKIFLCELILVSLFSININCQWYQQYSGTNSTLLSVQFVNENTGWIVGAESQLGYVLFKTTNGGLDWFRQDTLISLYEGIFTTFYFLNESTGWYIAYKFDETSNIYKTTDGGYNWELQFTTLPYEALLNDIQFTESSIGYTAGWGGLSSGYVYKSMDGGNNWELSLGTPPAILTTSLIFINSDTGWVAGSNILKTTDGGSTWQEQINIEPSNFKSIQFVNNQTGWACIDYPGGIFKTTDGGDNWIQQFSIELTCTFFVDTLIGWLINGNNIYKSENGGDDWILQNSNTDQELLDMFFIDQNFGWIVGQNGIILYTINGGLPVEFINFSAMVDVKDVTLLWTTASEINNSGFEIQKKYSPENYWKNIGFVKGNGTTTETHYFSFKDEDVSGGKYQYRLKQIDYNGSFDYSKIIEVEVGLPNDVSLGQNYPNPFNPSTQIKYTIPQNERMETQEVTLIVYDVIGNEITTLVNEEKPAGNYEVEFDAAGLPNGVYLYRMVTNNLVEIKKMVLLK